MTKTYTEVLEAIQKANPELMKLEIGCRILYGDKHEYPALFINWMSKTDDEISVLCCTLGNKKTLKREWIKILGKEPQLQHVLKATNKSNKYYHGIDSEGYFIQFRVGGYDQIAWKPGYFVHYDLSLPFSQQNESLYTFLHTILC